MCEGRGYKIWPEEFLTVTLDSTVFSHSSKYCLSVPINVWLQQLLLFLGQQVLAVTLWFACLQIQRYCFALSPQFSDESKKSHWFFSLFSCSSCCKTVVMTSKQFTCWHWNPKSQTKHFSFNIVSSMLIPVVLFHSFFLPYHILFYEFTMLYPFSYEHACCSQSMLLWASL